MLRWMVLGIFSLLPLGAQSVVEGVVVESVAKTPVAGATVQVIWTKPLTGTYLIQGENDQGPRMETDEAGRFRVDVPSPSEFTFKVTKDGFAPLEGKASERFALKEKEPKHDTVLIIQAECSIEGRVYDPDLEKPVEGLPIQALGQFSTRPGRNVFVPSKKVTTDADGRYRIDGLRPGKYRVIAGPSAPIVVHEVRESASRPTVYPQVFFPGSEDEFGAADLNLLPDARVGAIDFRVRKRNAFRVRGKVVRADGKPVTGEIRFSYVAEFTPNLTTVRGYGQLKDPSTFEIEPVVDGTFSLSGLDDSQSRRDRLWGSVPVNVGDKDVEDVLLVLRSGVTVTGTIQTEGAAPGKLDPLWAALEKDVTVDVIRETGYRWADEWPVAVDRESGRWKIDGVHLEPLKVAVGGLPPGYAVTAMEYNGDGVPIGRVDLNPGAIAHNLTIKVASVSNSIRGTVADDKKPIYNALVVIVREPVLADLNSRQQKFKITGKNGEYVFDTLEPGWYRIAAIRSEDKDSAVHDRIFSGDSKRVEIGKTTNATVDLEIK